MNPLYPQIRMRALARCEYCHAPEEVFNFAFEADHIIPQSLGGKNDFENLALSCHACNRFKSDSVLGFDVVSQQKIPLFNPRSDAWVEHFQADIDTAEIVGIDAIGKVTVTCLQMNRPHQINARRRWIQLGLYP